MIDQAYLSFGPNMPLVQFLSLSALFVTDNSIPPFQASKRMFIGYA